MRLAELAGSGQLSRRTGEFAGVDLLQPRQAVVPESVCRRRSRVFAFARQPFKMLRQLLDLEQDRARIFVVEQHEIEHRRNGAAARL